MSLLKIQTLAFVLALSGAPALQAEEMVKEEGAAADTAKKPARPGKLGKPGKEGKRGMLNEGAGRGYDLIIENEKELGISAEQKKKLEELHTRFMEKIEKLRTEPEMTELFREQYEARQSGDKEQLKEIRKKLRPAMEKRGLDPETVMAEFGKVLTREQLVKLAAIREKNGMDPNPMKTERDEKREDKAEAVTEQQRPDPSKGAPSLYDTETPAAK